MFRASSNEPYELPEGEDLDLLPPSELVRVYKDVINELGGHLRNVYEVAGGLRMLRLSQAARSALGIRVATAAERERVMAASKALLKRGRVEDGLFKQLRALKGSSASPSERARIRAEIMEQLESTRQLAPAATAEPCSTSEHTAPPAPDTAREPAAPRYAPAGGAGAPRPSLGRLCGSALAHEELANTSYGQLVALVGELQRTVGEQKADIADLEEALRESKTAVRTLRGQAKETELRRYAAAADAAGLRRTASILPGPRTLQPGWPSIFATCDGSMALDPSAVPAEGAELLPQIGSAVSLESAPHHDPKDTSNGAASPLAGSLNGWPVDGSDGVRYRMPADRASIASPEMAAAAAAGPAVAPGSPLSPSPQSVPARLPYKDSFASALGGSFESGGGGSLRKPRRLRTMVANGPRRLFSKMKRA